MFDFLRDLGKSATEKRQERLNAYLDDELKPRAREQFEQMLADDSTLQEEAGRLRQIKAGLRLLPRLPVPRNFLLSANTSVPDLHPAGSFYPILRTTTILTAFFFIFALVVNNLGAPLAVTEPVKVTRVVTQALTDEEVEGESVTEEEVAENTFTDEALSETVVTTSTATGGTVAGGDEDVEDDSVGDSAEEELADESASEAPLEGLEPVLPPLPTFTPASTVGSVVEATAAAQRVPATTTPPSTWTPVPTPSNNTDAAQVASGIGGVLTAPTVPWLEIGLGVVLLTLVGATLYTRRFL